MSNSVFNVETCFISKLLETKDITTVNDSQIKIDFFTGDNRNAFQFIQDTIVSSGEVPTIRVFKKQFPDYKLEMHYAEGKEIKQVGTDENMLYWCSELRRKVKHNAIADLLEDAAESLSDFNTERAYEEIKKRIAYIEGEVEESKSFDITQNTEERIQLYLKKKINKGMLGISTGFPKLDFMTKGLAKETLWVLIAKTGVGKTFFTILLAAQACLEGYKVLFFLTEMSEENVRSRFEAILYSLTNGELDYNKFLSGTMNREEENKYFKFLREDLPEMDSIIISEVSGVSSVSAAIETHKPDIVFIDSVYLMEDESRAKEDWLRVAHITRDLKKLAKRTKLPIFINTQADGKNTSKKTGPELDSIMYTQAIGQDADTVLALYRSELMLSDKEMGLKILKNREGGLGKITLNWNFNVMDFSEIYAEEKEPESSARITLE